MSCCKILSILILSTVIATISKVSATTHFKEGCPEGRRFGSRCLWISDQQANGYGSIPNCPMTAIYNEEENEIVKELMRKASVHYIWIKRDKDSAFDNFGYYGSGSGICFYMDKYGEWSRTDYCRATRKHLCGSDPECLEGWIGKMCDRQCHCYQKSCGRNHKRCDYGCEIGWSGDGCFKEAARPVVEHYCVKNRTHYSLVLTLDSKNGTAAGALVPLDLEGKSVTPRDYSHRFGVDGVFEISTKTLDSPFEPDFKPRKINEQTFEWSLRLRQHDNLRMQTDVDFRVQCDFSDIDVIYASTSLELDVSTFGKPSTSAPSPIEPNSKIVVLDPKDDNPLSDVTLGQPIKVALRQEDVKNGGLNGGDDEENQSKSFLYMSPRTCYAKSPDDVIEKQLTDSWGCRLDDDFFDWSAHGSEDLSSWSFAAFGVPGYSSMNISCSLVPCLHDDRRCRESCAFHSYYS